MKVGAASVAGELPSWAVDVLLEAVRHILRCHHTVFCGPSSKEEQEGRAVCKPLPAIMRWAGLSISGGMVAYVCTMVLRWWQQNLTCRDIVVSNIVLLGGMLRWTPWVAPLWLLAACAIWAARLTRAERPAKRDVVLWVVCLASVVSWYRLSAAIHEFWGATCCYIWLF
jgi:hypothetical protein